MYVLMTEVITDLSQSYPLSISMDSVPSGGSQAIQPNANGVLQAGALGFTTYIKFRHFIHSKME